MKFDVITFLAHPVVTSIINIPTLPVYRKIETAFSSEALQFETESYVHVEDYASACIKSIKNTCGTFCTFERRKTIVKVKHTYDM